MGLFGRISFGGRRRVGELAGSLEVLELVEGAVEGALDAGLVAAERGEDLGVFLEDIGEAAAWREAGVVLIHLLLIVD